jgi:hypothetical protein
MAKVILLFKLTKSHLKTLEIFKKASIKHNNSS